MVLSERVLQRSMCPCKEEANLGNGLKEGLCKTHVVKASNQSGS